MSIALLYHKKTSCHHKITAGSPLHIAYTVIHKPVISLSGVQGKRWTVMCLKRHDEVEWDII